MRPDIESLVMQSAIQEHPRLRTLAAHVLELPVPEDYRLSLLSSIVSYSEQIMARPYYLPGAGWNDLEALQQVTLADIYEEAIMQLAGNQGASETATSGGHDGFKS